MKFEQFNIGKKWDQLKKNPERAFIGAMDEFSTKAWNKLLGTNWDPMVDWKGGPTKKDYAAAEAAGIKTGSAKTAHTITQAIVGSAFGAAGMDKLGGAAGGSGGGLGGDYGMSEAGKQAAAGMYDGSSVVDLSGSSLEGLTSLGPGGASGGGVSGGGWEELEGLGGEQQWRRRGREAREQLAATRRPGS